jgi:uncharacterized protein (DUF2236 family)
MLSDGHEASPGTTDGDLDRGYFPSGESVLRRVQGERAVGLLYGQRALIIGALDARNYIGTAEHSRYRDLPFKRLAATGKMFETVFFGTKAEADKVLAVVERMHAKVEGELTEAAGPRYPIGTPYRAFDPELMLWTIAVAADSGCYFYERLVRPLSADEKNRYWADWARFGELFGMPKEVAPVGWGAFRAYFDGRLASDEMHLTEEARVTGFGVAFRIPFGAPGLVARDPHNLIMLGSLPPVVRQHYGLPWSRCRQLAYDATCRGLRASRPLSPKRIARGRNAIHFDNVAKAEGKLAKQGKPPIALPAR